MNVTSIYRSCRWIIWSLGVLYASAGQGQCEPQVTPTTSVNIGCLQDLHVEGLQDTSISWRSIFPGGLGVFNYLLSCTFDCADITVTSEATSPEYIDFRVCGLPPEPCPQVYICEDVRVFMGTPVNSYISPMDPGVCFGDTTTEVSFVYEGGIGPYDFDWSNGETDSTAALEAGTHELDLIDSTGCIVASTIFDVIQHTNAPVADAGADITVCSGQDVVPINGSVQHADGGLWIGQGGSFTSSSATLSNGYNPSQTERNAGMTFLVLQTIGPGTCESSTDTMFIYFDHFEGEINKDIIHVQCNGEENGFLGVYASGADAPYTYQWDAAAGGGTNNLVNDLAPGDYGITVTGISGCDTSFVTTIIEAPVLSISDIDLNIPTCHNWVDGSATVSIEGGLAEYDIVWSNGQFGPMAVGLDSDFYTVQVTDSLGCTVEESFFLQNPPPLSVSVSIDPIGCHNASDGSFTFTASGGIQPYDYYLETTFNSLPTFTGIGPGIYPVSLVDDNGCTWTSSVQFINPPPVVINTSPDVAICASDSTVNIDGTFTEADASYWWSANGSFEQPIETLANTYRFGPNDIDQGFAEIYLITQGPGSCEEDSAMMLVDLQFTGVEFSSSVDPVVCHGESNGVLSITAQGSDGPYTWEWSPEAGGGTGPTTSGLAAGDYGLTISSAGSCDTLIYLTVPEAPPLVIDSIVIQNPTCLGDADGTAQVFASGGMPDYSYLWDDGQDTEVASDLSSGVVDVSIRDEYGCVVESSAMLTDPEALEAEVIVYPITCAGLNDGSVFIDTINGIGPYQYQYGEFLSSEPLFEDIDDGTYYVTVFDGDGCTWQDSVVMLDPLPLIFEMVTDTSICDGAEVEISALVTGGTGDITYDWSAPLGPGQSHAVSPSDTTSYTVQAQDANGCLSDIATAYVNVLWLDTAALELFSIGNICPGGNASVQAEHTQDYDDFDYQWNIPAEGLGPHVVNPDTSTYYVFTVSDFCGNSIADTIDVFVYDAPDYLYTGFATADCGQVLVDLDNGNTIDDGFEYFWDFGNGTFSSDPNPIAYYDSVGSYDITVTLTNQWGCITTITETDAATVHPLTEAVMDASPTVTNMEDPLVEFIDLSDGQAASQWFIEDGAQYNGLTGSHEFMEPGFYDIMLVTFTDFGCSDTTVTEIYIKASTNVIIPNAFTPTVDGEADGYYDPTDLDNDIFYPFTDYVASYRLNIVNRWGELVFFSDELERGWNGQCFGGPCPQDVYIYQLDITWEDGSRVSRTGDLTLFR